MTSRNSKLSEILKKLVQPAGLVVKTHRGQIFVTTEKRPVEELPLDKELTSVADLAAQRALEQEWPLFFVETPLFMVLEMIEGMTGQPMDLDRAALRREKISLSVPVTIQAQKISLDQALTQILEPLGMRHELIDGSIVITTKG